MAKKAAPKTPVRQSKAASMDGEEPPPAPVPIVGFGASAGGSRRSGAYSKTCRRTPDTNDAITVIDPTGRFRAWNPAAEGIYGYSALEALGRGLEIIVPERGLAETRALIEQVRRGERVAPKEVVRRIKDGRDLDVWLTLSLLVDAAGAPNSFACIECPVEVGTSSDGG